MGKFIYGLVALALFFGTAVNAGNQMSQSDAQAIQVLQNKCIKTKGQEKGMQEYTKITLGSAELLVCIQNHVDLSSFTNENSQPNFDVKKACKERAEIIKCVSGFARKVEPCLEADERDSVEVSIRLVESSVNFICKDDGKQIDAFIAGNGVECLKSKKEQIQRCSNTTLAAYQGPKGKLVLDQKYCDDMQKFGACTVKEMKTCQNASPATIVESLFATIKKDNVCSGAATIFSPLALLLSLYYAITKMISG